MQVKTQKTSLCKTVNSNGDSLPRRGGMMLFLLYTFQQMGGASFSENKASEVSGKGISFLKTLNQNSRTGINNIEFASGKSFFTLFLRFLSHVGLR